MARRFMALFVCAILGPELCRNRAGQDRSGSSVFIRKPLTSVRPPPFFADQVKKLTNGKLKIKVFWPGQLVKSREALESLKSGMIDGYSGSFLYFTGVFPEVNVQWLPFNWSSPAEAKDILLNKGYHEIFAEAMSKHGVTFLSSISVATMGLMTKFPVNNLADLQGKKIRAFGLEALIVEALGAAAAAIPGAEQYMALQRGTVDGTDYPWYTLKKYKLYEVLNYVSDPAFPHPRRGRAGHQQQGVHLPAQGPTRGREESRHDGHGPQLWHEPQVGPGSH